MKKTLSIAIALFFIAGVALAKPPASTMVKVTEADGSPAQFVNTLSFTNGTVSVSGSTATVTIAGVSPGSGSVTTLKEQDAQIGDADIVSIDFQEGFHLEESPDTEINISLDVTPSSGSATLVVEEDAVQVKYDSTDFQEGANGLYLGDSPTIPTSILIGADPGDTAGVDIGLPNAAIIAFEDATEATITHVDNTGLAFNLGIDVQGAGGITLENDATITNSTDTQIKFSGTGDEDIAIDLDTATDNEVAIVSGSDVTQLDIQIATLKVDAMDIDGNVDIGDFDISSIDKLEGVDSAVYIDMGTDGYIDIEADTGVRVTAPTDFGDEDLTSLDKLEGVDTAVFIDMGTDTLLELQADGSIQLDTPSVVLTTQATDLDLKTAEAAALTIDDGGTPMITFDTANDDIEIDTTLIVDGTLDANGVVALGDGSDNFSVASDGIDIDTSGNISNAGTIGATGDITIAAADPDLVFDDTDGADGNIQVAANDADDAVMTLSVDDSEGDDTGYIELDGVNDRVDILQPLYTAGTSNFSAGAVTLGTISGAIDAGGATSFEIPSGTSGTTNATGEIYLDTDGDGGDFDGPVLQVSTNDATVGYFVSVAALPSDDNYILKYDAATDVLGWEEDVSAGSPTWNSVGNPDDNASIDMTDYYTALDFGDTDHDMFTIQGTGAFGNYSIVKIEQATGDATDGDVLSLVTTDNDVDHLVFETNDSDSATVKLADSGTLTIDVTSNGTAAVDIVDGLTVGSLTSDAGIAIADDGNIGSATDSDSIAINSTGEVTFSQEIQASAGIDAGATDILLTGSIAATGSRVTKGWFTDLEISNLPTVGGATISPTNITPVDTGNEDATFYPILADGATGTQATETDVELTYNPSTGILTTPNLDVLGAPFPADPGADRVLAWDDSETGAELIWSSAGSGDILADGSVPFTGDVEINSATPALTFTDTDSAAGTATLSFQATDANDLVASLQTDIAGTPTTFIELDGVTETVDILKTLAIGSDPADAGTGIRMSNNSVIEFEDSENTGEVTALQVDASEAILIGDNNASGVTITPNVTLSGTLTDGTATLNSGALSGVSTLGVSDAITLSDGATIDQSANNYVSFAENSDTAQFYFGGTDVDLIWSDGVLNIRNAEDGVDAIVEIEGKDAGEKGELRVLSDGDDKYIAAYHNDTDGVIASSSGDIRLAPDGDTDDYAMVSTDTNVTSISVTGGTGTLGTAAAEWDKAYFGDSSVLYFGADQDVTLTHVADTALSLNLDLRIADNQGLVLGSGQDFDLYYDEATDDRLELASTNAAADTEVYIYNTDATYATNLELDGTVTASGFISNGSGDSYVEMNSNASAPTLSGSNGFYFVSDTLKFYEGGSEIDPVTNGDSPTWTGDHVFDTGSSLTLSSTEANSAGKISFDSTAWAAGRGAQEVYDGTALTYVIAALASDTPGDGEVPKWNTGGTITWESDESGSLPALSDVGNPSGDSAISFDAGEEVAWNFDGNFSTGTQFGIISDAGTQTGGILFGVQGNNDNITAIARFGDSAGSNYWEIAETASSQYTLRSAGGADLDVNEQVSINMDNAAEEVTITNSAEYGANGAQVTIQNSDADVGAQNYLLDLDWSADDGQANADYIIAQDSGGTVWVLGQDGDISTTDGDYTTTNGTVSAEQLTTTDDISVTDDVLLSDGSVVGITGNEIITFNAAGTINFSGASVDVDGAFTAASVASDGAVSGTEITASTSVDITGATGLILENDETITNSSDGTVLVTGALQVSDGNAFTVNSVEIVGADGEVNSAAIEDSYLANNGDVGTGTYDFGGATLEIPNTSSGDQTLTIGQLGLKADEDMLVTHGGAAGEVQDEAGISLISHVAMAFDPAWAYDQESTYRTLPIAYLGDDFPHGLTMVEWKVAYVGGDPDTELDADIMCDTTADFNPADDATVMDVIDTTAGVSTADSGFDSATCANGSQMYIRFGADPTDANVMVALDIWYFTNED